MLKTLKIRALVLATQGMLILMLGLAFLYLRANMTNALFSAIDLGVAIFLAVGVLILAALADWVAALGEGMEHFRRFAFYSLAGIGLLICAIFVTYLQYKTMDLLLSMAAAHALAFSVSVLIHGLRHRSYRTHRAGNWLSGSVSALFAIATIAIATSHNDFAAITALGAYYVFVGVRMLVLAKRFYETSRAEQRSLATTH